ncbi:hypothetical protein CQ052_19270 [Ochrobactrum sp. MYb15]|nr:hypothetical protein CQZ90_19700 [Ochrobactrum sp. MYb19]PRA46485.1 hypothetical protein CQ062_23645 [Ochrobactrum sp. MYb68]PRA61068.1 hypothetical protein CQ053_20570 [Ochrobactrum sp. MYb18]PRA74774.1 hypothetical protein CQ049_16335 [Brucella thiophenivorans]PRA86246.1 hypothetical protein CQ051_20145 [Ochrobactrum sp. MYb14]PRA97047.1 hypothetical protein CQ052_19270 [Ochrobactrum sp. MYb15]
MSSLEIDDFFKALWQRSPIQRESYAFHRRAVKPSRFWAGRATTSAGVLGPMPKNVGQLCAFMSDVRDAEKFADSGRFAFHTANDREGVGRGPTTFGKCRQLRAFAREVGQ